MHPTTTNGGSPRPIPLLPSAPSVLNRAVLSPGSHPLRQTLAYGSPLAAPQPQPAYISATPVIHVEDEPSPSERKCTNLGWMVAFSCFLALSIFVAINGLLKGRPARLAKGANFKGLVCGVDAAVKHRPFLYFPLDPSHGDAPPSAGSAKSLFGGSKHTLMMHDGRCVASCPTEEDMTGGAVVAMTERVTRHRPELGSTMVLEFEVATPAYATEPAANSHCLPLDPKLRSQVLNALSSATSQLRFGVSSLIIAWPVVLGHSSIALFLALIATWVIRQLPVLTVYASAVGGIASLLVGGALCVVWGNRVGNASHQNLTSLFTIAKSFLIVLGLIMVPLSSLIFLVWLKSAAHRSRASRVLDMCGDVFADMPNLIAAPIIACAVSFAFLWGWLVVFLHLCGLASTRAVPDFLFANGDENSLTSLVPLHQTSSFPFGGAIALLVWFVLLFWFLQFLSALTHFAACYAGTIWYFASPEGSDDKDIGWCPVLVALSLGLANHFGSFALGGILMGLTAPCRALFSFVSNKNLHGCTDDSATFLNQLIQPLPYKTRVKKMVDHLTVGGFVEMAISSADMGTSFEVSSRRLALPHSPASRLSSSLDSTLRYLNLTICLPITLLTYATVADPRSSYAAPQSAYFVSSPLVVALFTFLFSWTFVSFFSSMWISLCDALFYSYLVESSSPSGEIDENPAEKLHAHAHLRDLVVETMDEFGY